MQIGEVARKSGLAASTIRYYESLGLLPAPRRRAGRRIYDGDVLRRLAVIRHCVALGFPLATIQKMGLGLAMVEPAPATWHDETTTRLADIDAQIAELIAARQQLIALQQCDCPSIAACELLGIT